MIVRRGRSAARLLAAQRQQLIVLSTSLAVAAAICLPLARRGWILLLDWTSGPTAAVSRTFWGFDGGPLYGPFAAGVVVLGHLIGAATTQWAVIAALFPVAALGMSRLVGGSSLRRGAAALLYCVNPFVYDRISIGQIQFLAGVALVPWAVAALLHGSQPTTRRRVHPGLLVGAAIATVPHFAWILAVPTAAVVAYERLRRRVLLWAAGVVAVTVAVSAHLLIPQLVHGTSTHVTAAQLVPFRTRGGSSTGVLANALGLYGLFRGDSRSSAIPGWPLLLGAILIVVVAGAVHGLRDARLRRTTAVLITCGIAGLVLALGDRGPAGSLYRLVFLHVPGFAIMREPQKFLSLTVLAYGGLFGIGAEALWRRTTNAPFRVLATTTALLLPIAYAPALFWGLDGSVRPRHYPQSWVQADKLLGRGDGKVLFLPWHKYLSFSFTHRTVSNPAGALFQRDVIASDHPAAGVDPPTPISPRTDYLEHLFRVGPTLHSFGALVAPLGVEYVVVSRNVDWRRYDWLVRQRDLQVVFDRPDLIVYRNTRARPPGQWVHTVEVVRDRAALVARVERNAFDDAGRAFVLAADAPAGLGPGATAGRDDGRASVRRRSATTYHVRDRPATPGYVLLPEPYDRGWSAGHGTLRSAEGLSLVRMGQTSNSVRFQPWRWLWLSYLTSLVAASAVIWWARRRPS